jgi:hypothetical protein
MLYSKLLTSKKNSELLATIESIDQALFLSLPFNVHYSYHHSALKCQCPKERVE